MHRICDAAHEAGISAIIASDVAVMSYCNEIGQEVHLSTQLNISNVEALKFYARFADVVVLARELNLDQVRQIYEAIEREKICRTEGRTSSVSKCSATVRFAWQLAANAISLDNLGRSANRGECMQICRRSYTVRDRETGVELDVDNKYIMSPKDLKTINFIDRMMEGRCACVQNRRSCPQCRIRLHRGVSCYKEAIAAVEAGTFTPELVESLTTRLATVFNRGFWDGYYLGRKLGEWSDVYGSHATEKKQYVGKGMKYFSKLGVGEFHIEAGEFEVGDKMLIIGPTTGALYVEATDIHGDNGPVEKAVKGMRVSIPVPEKIRPSDKLYKVVKQEK